MPIDEEPRTLDDAAHEVPREDRPNPGDPGPEIPRPRAPMDPSCDPRLPIPEPPPRGV